MTLWNARKATTLMLSRPTRSATQPQGASSVVRARELRAFTLGASQRDVRGWPVHASDARRVGRVAALFVDVHAKRVRYLGVELAEAAAGRSGGGHVLVPVGAARRVDERGLVALDALTARQLAEAPRLALRPVTRADEEATLAAYGLATTPPVPSIDFYCGPTFDETPLLAAARD